jgi:hypothetical protein
MKGARRREPVRTKRIIRLTLIASAFYAVFAVRIAFAQPSQSSNHNSPVAERPDSSWSSPSSSFSSSSWTSSLYSSRNSNSSGGEHPGNPGNSGNAGNAGANSNSRPPKTRGFDGGFMRAQHRMSKQAGGNRQQAVPVVQPAPQVDPQPPERPPRHAVMTADERRLLRQHIEEAVRDLYKR